MALGYTLSSAMWNAPVWYTHRKHAQRLGEYRMHNPTARPEPALGVDAIDALYLTRLLHDIGQQDVEVVGCTREPVPLGPAEIDERSSERVMLISQNRAVREV